jgi:hypothetical protein
VFELGEPERQGMDLFLRYARQLDALRHHPSLTPASAL